MAGYLPWPDPVSYTHLDVYKRQVFIAAGVAINPEGAIRQFIEEKRAAENGLNDKPDLFADKTKQ